MRSDSSGQLFLVPTPIGNLQDLTERAVKTLKEVDLVACEDTRHSGRLLKALEIKTALISYHDFNESRRSEQLLSQLKSGKSIAVITDAGSPGISDPAYRIVRTAIDNDIEIVPLPGPCAIIPALTASGLPTDRFFFEGFLPVKSGARLRKLGQLKDLAHTLVFYESPFRIEKTLSAALEVLGDREACLAREISKLYEQFIRGPLGDILATIQAKPVKGEIVLVIAGADYTSKKKTEPADE
ncbi:MAG: 16S rRNA (cytidine(1402)-2'-O)-methyltransferase [bacterium]|nr:16S rRNA (cytidine(1402)-2'-O)-methyltransferase [bacterium]